MSRNFLVTEHGGGCFEVCVGSTRLLLDFTTGPSSGLLRYLPLSRPAAASSWRCVERAGRWLVDGEVRIELPQTDGIDFECIDAVLVSSTEALLALPFITEYTSFRGAIYTTTAVKRFGRHALLEFVALCEALHELPVPYGSDDADSTATSPSPSVAGEIWDAVERSRLPVGMPMRLHFKSLPQPRA